MTDLGHVHLLRNTPVRGIINALERDGFTLRRTTQTGGNIYTHPDGRMTVIHNHKGSDILTRKTLRSIIKAVRWNEQDLKRLGLIK